LNDGKRENEGRRADNIIGHVRAGKEDVHLSPGFKQPGELRQSAKRAAQVHESDAGGMNPSGAV